MKDSYLTAGIRIRPLLQLLLRNHIAWTPRNTARILFLLQSSIWSSFFSRIEKARFGHAISCTPVPDDPIFIVGHWRTGSTFLHQLMSKDPNLAVPSLFQVALPDNFLVSGNFYKPIFNSILGKHRPMDNVQIGINEPQEDEYAIFRLTTYSPLEQLIFPKRKEYFLQSAGFLPPADKMETWMTSFREFYRKLRFSSGKRIVSKNPFNSYRIPLLATLFPNARFIHIVRHPFSVVPSTRHLWAIVQQQNILNRNSYLPDEKEISLILNSLMTDIQSDFSKLPGYMTCVIRFEDLEKNPKGELERLYTSLGIPFTTEFTQNVDRFLQDISGYKKNQYSLASEQKDIIRTIMFQHMERYNYLENV